MKTPTVAGILVVLIMVGPSHAQVTESDSLALVTLYNSTDGPNWRDNTNWLTGPVASWVGVLVTGDRVTELFLIGNQLTGPIPPELGNLTGLTHLYLSSNRLSGAIPPELGTLSNLDALQAGNNQLTGEIPSSLGNLTNLTSLFLGGNQLTGEIPSSLGNLTRMEDLQLFGNALEGPIPPMLGNFAELRVILFQDNQFMGSIPPELGNLTNLEQLLLHGNQLSGPIPSALGNLSRLRYLDLGTNKLTGSIPTTLGTLTNLEAMYLGGNDFTGSFPSWITSLTELNFLSLDNNQLTGEIPSALGNLTKLITLALGRNQLSSTIPPELGTLTNLESLYLSGQDIHGEIPPELSNLTKLIFLSCSEANLTGTLPSELSNLTELEFMHFGNNQLTGPIPPEYGNLTKLNTLLFFHNQLTGPIPSELGNMVAMEELRLQGNQFTGAVPASFVNMTALRELVIFDNELEDLPDLSNLAALEVMIVGNNRFTFEDLEPNIGAAQTEFSYAPQAPVGMAQSLTLDAGDPLTLSLSVGGTNNQYQWHKDDVPLDGASSDTYTSSFVTAEDTGTYVLSVTNTIVPDLVIESEPIDVSVTEETPVTQGYPLALTEATYRMVSVPLELADTGAAVVFEDDYGSYNPEQWRLFRWREALDDYDEYPDIGATFTPGTAFWLITSEGTGFDVDEATSVNRGRPYALQLLAGWNQIGSPFPFTIAWNTVEGAESVEAPVWFDGVEYRYDQPTLEPWEGYFVYNDTGGPVTIRIPPAAAAQKVATAAHSISARGTYGVHFSATLESHGLRNTQTYVGFAEGAAAGRDTLDVTEAPGIGDYLRVSIVEAEDDLAASFKPSEGEGQTWDIEVEAVLERELYPTLKRVQVTLEDHGGRPEGMERFVIDRDRGRVLARQAESLEVILDQNYPVGHLRLIVGTRSYAETHSEDVPLVPLTFALEANYPNPFNPETIIPYQTSQRERVVLAVYNVLGQHVHTLVDQEEEAGLHTVHWDGRAASGRPVASGVYFYRMQAGAFQATRQMLLMR